MVTRMTEPQKQQEEITKHGTMINKGNPSKPVQNMRLKLKEIQTEATPHQHCSICRQVGLG